MTTGVKIAIGAVVAWVAYKTLINPRGGLLPTFQKQGIPPPPPSPGYDPRNAQGNTNNIAGIVGPLAQLGSSLVNAFNKGGLANNETDGTQVDTSGVTTQDDAMYQGSDWVPEGPDTVDTFSGDPFPN
jgi:hypothetical protein